jgi:hypothetical protein
MHDDDSRDAPLVPPAERQQGGSSGVGTPDATRLLRPALLFYGAMLAVAWAICWWTDGSPFVHPAVPRPGGVRPLTDAVIGVAAGALLIGLSELATRCTRTGEVLADTLAELLRGLSVVDCLVLALASGLAEEAFFRGMLQPHIGLVATTLVFGLVHFVPRRELAVWSLFAAAAGLLCGVLYESTGNLIAPAVAHATVNAVNLTLLSRRSVAPRDPVASPGSGP